MRDLRGKVAVVTGAGSGIGRAIALRLGAEGARVVVADIDLESARAVAKQVLDAGGEATAHPVDVSSEEGLRALRVEVLDAHRVVDVLVNNAGIAGAPADFVDTPLPDVRRILEINLVGTITGTAVFLPDLLTRERAGLVNICSYTGLLGATSMVAYSTSKFGVRGFTESLRMELAGTAVAVTLVMPGGTRTAMMANSPLVANDRKESLQTAFDKAPMVSPDVVASGVLKGIRGAKPRVLVGKDTKVLDVITRLAPGRYSTLLAKPMKATVARTFGG
jgi:short-subunit dehydrogenase